MHHFNIGIVGCGEVTQIIHLPSLVELADRFRVTALCDVSQAVLDGVGERWGVASRFLDYHELVEQPDVDAILIANPHAYHAQVTLAAIATGKHVLVEKPMCITHREAAEIIAAREAAARRGAPVTVQVGFMRRYAPAFLEACRLAREMGEIRLARVHDVIGQNALIIQSVSHVLRGKDIPEAVIAEGQQLLAALIDEAIGKAPPELRSAYALLLGLSSHDTSAMREMLGMPSGVLYASQRQRGRYLTAAFDYGDFICTFDTGVDAIPRYDTTLEVFGANRALRVRWDTPYVRHLPTRLFVSEANDSGGLDGKDILPAWGDPFVEEWKSFYTNVVEKREPKTSPEDFTQDLDLFQHMIALMRG